MTHSTTLNTLNIDLFLDQWLFYIVQCTIWSLKRPYLSKNFILLTKKKKKKKKIIIIIIITWRLGYPFFEMLLTLAFHFVLCHFCFRYLYFHIEDTQNFQNLIKSCVSPNLFFSCGSLLLLFLLLFHNLFLLPHDWSDFDQTWSEWPVGEWLQIYQ